MSKDDTGNKRIYRPGERLNRRRRTRTRNTRGSGNILSGLMVSATFAIILVAISGFLITIALNIFVSDTSFPLSGFTQGIQLTAASAAAINWIVFPFTWLYAFSTLSISIGSLAFTGSSERSTYSFCGAFAGATAMSITPYSISLVASSGTLIAGAILTSLIIGALSGWICARIFVSYIPIEQYDKTF